MSEILSFFTPTAKELEPLLVEELKALGAKDVQEKRAGASFCGTLEMAYRVCLGSRIANRVLLPILHFPASTPEKLYGGVKAIRWSDHLGPSQTLAVDFSSAKSQITHTHFGALKVKDAIVDQIRSIHGSRPSVDPVRPDVRVNVYLLEDQATVSIDLSGDSLHRRGYREMNSPAPLKENLAAALLLAAEWPKRLKDQGPDFSFVDPMCGSGTLPIEAAWIAANITPGLGRKYFGFLGWRGHDPRAWKRVVEEAMDQEIRDPKRLPKIIGYDHDFRAVRLALANVERAGLHGRVHIEKRELSFAERVSNHGVVLTNPPYGERLGEAEELKALYTNLGDLFKNKFKGWEGYIFTGNPDLAKTIGLRASRRFVFFNGAMECRLLKFELY